MPLPTSVPAALSQLRNMLSWTLPLKLVLSSLLGVLGGAGLLGYLSEYATYSYAIYFGFRPPLEGIPYLKATVALGSFILLLTGAAVFSFSILLVKFFVWSIEWTFTSGFSILKRMPRSQLFPRSLDFAHVTSRLRTRAPWQVILIALAVATVVGPIAYFEADFLNQLVPGGSRLPPLHFAPAMAAVAFLVTIALANARAIWWLAGTATLGYFVTWLVVLFSPVQYSGFLRLVGYGGGIPVTVELREAGPTQLPSAEKFYLMLRTTEALLLLSETGDTFVEIPRDQLRKVTHRHGGLRTLPYRMPADHAPAN